MISFKCIQAAEHLPCQWDELTQCYFQQTKFLLHTQKFNPCKQRYYLCYNGEMLVSCAIIYTLQIDIFTFVKVKSPLKMHVVGVPCSVSSSGIFGFKDAVVLLKKHIYQKEKGFVLFLNLVDKPGANTSASGKTLPTIVLTNRFKNWDEYISTFRSSYRRRLIQISNKNGDLHFRKLSCAEFNHEMHQQYIDVYKRSSGKLEKLTLDFFKNLPTEFKLTVCFKKDKIIGWNIGLEDKDVYYFFLGGVDYSQNKIYDTYFQLLTSIVKDGIENKVKTIELGQTAEIPKMRMGGLPQPLYMEAHHNLKGINYLIKICSPWLEYKGVIEKTNALKEVNS